MIFYLVSLSPAAAARRDSQKPATEAEAAEFLHVLFKQGMKQFLATDERTDDRAQVFLFLPRARAANLLEGGKLFGTKVTEIR